MLEILDFNFDISRGSFCLFTYLLLLRFKFYFINFKFLLIDLNVNV